MKNVTAVRQAILLMMLLWPVDIWAKAALTVRLELTPARTLPSIPVGLRLAATNSSDLTIRFPRRMVVQIRNEAGAVWLAPWGADGHREVESLPAAYEDQDEVGEGETQVFLAAIGSTLCDPAVFQRLEPGKYEVQVALADDFHRTGDEERRMTTLAEYSAVATELVVTNAAGLVVVQPEGDDAVVWQLIKQSGGWCPSLSSQWALASEIWQNHPSSGYTPYVAGALGPHADTAAVRIRLAKAYPESAIRPWFDLGEAYGHILSYSRALNFDRDVRKSLAEAAVAREVYCDLIRTTRNEEVRAQATTQELTIRSDAEIIAEDRFLRSREAQPPAGARPVLPLLDCSGERDDETAARFGYENPNSFAVTLAVGSRNAFEPAPADRGQPTAFLPGRHPGVFTVRPQGKSLQWNLDGKSVGVNRSEGSLQCSGS